VIDFSGVLIAENYATNLNLRIKQIIQPTSLAGTVAMA
jgi:hypothetical protein